MIYLVNYTNEAFDYQFCGLSYTVKAGETRKVQDSEGNHALNALGARGLSKKEFDEEGKIINEDKNRQDAIARNKEFKTKQVYNYNFRNEQRKAHGLAYDTPTKVVKQYAVELGINLLQPYSMAEGEKAEIAKLHKESETKDNLIAELAKQIKEQGEMLAEMKKQMVIKPTMPNDMISCSICGEEVMAKMMKSHMNYKHKDKT